MTEVEWLRIFSNNMYEFMKEGYLTQEDIAEMTGCNQSTVSRWLNGTQAPSVFAIVNIAHAFNIDYNDLIDFGDVIKR